MKNIAIITSCLTNGGAEKAAGQLSRVLARHYNVYVILVSEEKITYDYDGELVQLHFKDYYNKMLGGGGFFRKCYAQAAYLKTIREMKKVKKELKIDCSISFLDTPNIMNILSSIGEKIIVSVRNNRSLQHDSYIQKAENVGIRMFYNHTNKVISLSYGVADDLISNFNIRKEKIETIYNFFDFDGIKYKSQMELDDNLQELVKGKKVILTMGRLERQKNTANLVSQCEHILSSGQDVILIILGKGSLENEIKEQIVELNLEDKVYMLGYCENPFPLIKRADLFIMNSLYEGFCNSIVEAMACGTMVISTDCLSGPREIIAGNTEYRTRIEEFTLYDRGILVPLNTKSEMQKAIEYALENDGYRQKCIANASAFLETISNERAEKQWIEIIEQ